MLAARLLSLAAGAAIRLLRATIRVERLHGERCEALRARRVPILFALWHGRMFLSILEHRGKGIGTMASRSTDGEIIARWLERNGYAVARGSSSRAGAAGLRELLRLARGGRDTALTVDGPQGPPRVVQPGVVLLARATGAWILPITSSCSRPRFLASWDRYLLPLPFSRGVVAYGEPFAVPEELSDEEAARRLAGELDRATVEADAAAGVTPPPPWPAR